MLGLYVLKHLENVNPTLIYTFGGIGIIVLFLTFAFPIMFGKDVISEFLDSYPILSLAWGLLAMLAYGTVVCLLYII